MLKEAMKLDDDGVDAILAEIDQAAEAVNRPSPLVVLDPREKGDEQRFAIDNNFLRSLREMLKGE
jgi:hypothetical protein